MNADFSRTCEGCEHVVTEPWAKDILSYRCFAPGRCKGRVVGVKRFDPYIPAWCPKLKKNGGMKMKLWKKVLATVTAGVLCLGSVGVSGVQNMLESVVRQTNRRCTDTSGSRPL